MSQSPHPSQLAIGDFIYHLPDNRIATYPLEERDASKLLVYKGENIDIQGFRSLPDLLPSGTLLIFNDTRVINARILFQKKTGGRIEIFCLEPAGRPEDYSKDGHTDWLCMVGGAAKWKGEILEKEISVKGRPGVLRAELKERKASGFIIRFSWEPAAMNFEEVLAEAGIIPLPPYIKRDAEEADKERYQTIYAKEPGSVAAPTAGLHFSPYVMKKLSEKGIDTCFVTLQVSAGTFKPVEAEKMEGHRMHAEWIEVTRDLIERLAEHEGPVTAIGTTSARTLETLYWLGVKTFLNKDLPHVSLLQWDVYEEPLCNSLLKRQEAFFALLEWMKTKNMQKLITQTELMIAPGYRYRVISSLVTNFHQPGSTLLLLVAAAVGDDWKKIYETALENDFRFLSYGDSSLLFVNQG